MLVARRQETACRFNARVASLNGLLSGRQVAADERVDVRRLLLLPRDLQETVVSHAKLPKCFERRKLDRQATIRRKAPPTVSITLYAGPACVKPAFRAGPAHRYFLGGYSSNSQIVGPSMASVMFSRTRWAVTGGNAASSIAPRFSPR